MPEASHPLNLFSAEEEILYHKPSLAGVRMQQFQRGDQQRKKTTSWD